MLTTSPTRTRRDTCDVQYVNQKNVEYVVERMPDDSDINALAEEFKTLADPTRIRIIVALKERELCVCDLASILGLTGSAVSHQLRMLRGQKLVKYRKDGKIAFYTLDDEHIDALITQGMRHVSGK